MPFIGILKTSKTAAIHKVELRVDQTRFEYGLPKPEGIPPLILATTQIEPV